MSIYHTRFVISALKHYVRSEPFHTAGLCHWLRYELKSAGYEGDPFRASYVMIDEASKAGLITLLPTGYVAPRDGFNTIRAALALRLVVLLESGKLVVPL